MAQYKKRHLINIKTKEEKYEYMWDDEYIKFLEKEKEWKPYVNAGQTFSIGDPVRLGFTKPPDSFNDLLKNIKKRNPGSNIETW